MPNNSSSSTNDRLKSHWLFMAALFVSFNRFSSLRTMATAASQKQRILYIVRHGQAQHNPRAEVAKANGCSMEEFFALMREDDVLDAELTTLGQEQAKAVRLRFDDDTNGKKNMVVSNNIDLVVASPLSRALQTADGILNQHGCKENLSSMETFNRVCCEHFREVNGDMLNAQRRAKKDLKKRFPHWDFDHLSTEEDTQWTNTMEQFETAAERGYQGLCWLLERPKEEQTMLLISHGGILRYTMNIHPLVSTRDGRLNRDHSKDVQSRFDNCEVRRYLLSWGEEESSSTKETTSESRRKVVLTQLDH